MKKKNKHYLLFTVPIVGLLIGLVLMFSVYGDFLPFSNSLIASSGFDSTYNADGVYGTPSIITTVSYSGAGSLQCALDSTNNLYYNLPGPTNSLTVDLAIRFTQLPSAYSGDAFIYVYGTSGNVVGSLGVADFNSGPTWYVYGSGVTIQDASVSANTWYVVKYLYDYSAGRTIVTINGVQVSDTSNTYNQQILAVQIGSCGAILASQWSPGGIGYFDAMAINTDTPINSAPSSTPLPSFVPTPTPTPFGATPTPTPTSMPFNPTATPTTMPLFPNSDVSGILSNPAVVYLLIAVFMIALLIVLYYGLKSNRRKQ